MHLKQRLHGIKKLKDARSKLSPVSHSWIAWQCVFVHIRMVLGQELCIGVVCGMEHRFIQIDDQRELSTKDEFSVYFGYRFRAPKTISKPIDLIEDKVPILKDDYNKR